MLERKVKVFECICHDTNHLLVVTHWWDEHDEDDDWEEFYIEVQAHYSAGFFRRIWQGMKYVWNPEDGCFWSGTSLDREEAQKLANALNDFARGMRPNDKE